MKMVQIQKTVEKYVDIHAIKNQPILIKTDNKIIYVDKK